MFFTLQLNLLWILSRNNVNLMGHVTGYEQCRPLLVSTLKICVNTVSSSCVSWLIYINVFLTLSFTGDLLTIYYFHLTCLIPENERVHVKIKKYIVSDIRSLFCPRSVLTVGLNFACDAHKRKLKKHSTVISFFRVRNHDPVTRHNPQTLLWAVSWRNYFLYSCSVSVHRRGHLLLDERWDAWACFKTILLALSFKHSVMTVCPTFVLRRPGKGTWPPCCLIKYGRLRFPIFTTTDTGSQWFAVLIIPRSYASPDRHLALFVFPVDSLFQTAPCIDAILGRGPRCTSEICSWRVWWSRGWSEILWPWQSHLSGVCVGIDVSVYVRLIRIVLFVLI